MKRNPFLSLVAQDSVPLTCSEKFWQPNNPRPGLRRRILVSWILPLLLLTLAATGQAQFSFTTNNDAITITGYTGSGGAVSIPSTINGLPVTTIGPFAFHECTSLTSVTIPDTVTAIGDAAFLDCSRLTNVTIPNHVTSVGVGTFAYCTSLTSITIPDTVTNLGIAVFYECSSLTEIYFEGNAPTLDGWGSDDTGGTAYYLPGTTG
jgi:Leucine Rich Repeat (LRR) protein